MSAEPTSFLSSCREILHATVAGLPRIGDGVQGVDGAKGAVLPMPVALQPLPAEVEQRISSCTAINTR
ncbi:hypothetical protein ASE66_26415 [Bosea sp. Root483D1]|nr:hypothetical protein ASE66_26415 [Bosea sp. Root483D1]